MSTGLECSFAHLRTQWGTGWFYLLETYPIGPDGGDMIAYGPFPSFDRALKHLDDHHANPGGWINDPEDALAREPTSWEAQWLTAKPTR